MRWCLSTPGSAEYIHPVTLATCVTPVSPINSHRSIKIYLEAVIEWVWRCSWRLRSSEPRVALRDWEIEWTQGCTWRPWLREFGDALRDQDRVNSEMHLEAVIEPVGRYTWKPWSFNIEGVLGGGWSGGNWSGGNWFEGCQSGGCQSGGSESGGSESGGSRWGGMRYGSSDCICWLTCNCGNVDICVQQCSLRAERRAGRRRQSISGWWSMQCTKYMVYALRGVCSTQCKMYLVYAVLGVCCTWYMLYVVLTHDHGMEK